MTNQVSTTKATFEHYTVTSSLDGSSVFYYVAQSPEYYVQVIFFENYPDVLFSLYAIVDGEKVRCELFPTIYPSKHQIALILAFSDPQELIDYALSLVPTPSPNAARFRGFNLSDGNFPCTSYSAINEAYHVIIEFGLFSQTANLTIVSHSPGTSRPFKQYECEILFELDDLTKEQIDLILSFDDPQTLIDYALTLMNKDKVSTPCPVPIVPSDDGDRASLFDYDQLETLFILVNTEIDLHGTADQLFSKDHLQSIKNVLLELDKSASKDITEQIKTMDVMADFPF